MDDLESDLSSLTEQIGREYDDLIIATENSIQTRMGTEINLFSFQTAAQHLLHCQVEDVADIFAHIRITVPWYDLQLSVLKKLIDEFGNNTDREKLMQFEEHRNNYLFDTNRLRMVARGNELYNELGLNSGAVLLLFLIDSRWNRICSNKWCFDIHEHIMELVTSDITLSRHVYYCTVAKASSIMPL